MKNTFKSFVYGFMKLAKYNEMSFYHKISYPTIVFIVISS